MNRLVSEISNTVRALLGCAAKVLEVNAARWPTNWPVGPATTSRSGFQDEFYRCYCNEVGLRVRICSEWTGLNRGRIDFTIVEPGWGIEMLRDGDRLKGHCNRFRQKGCYYPWIKRGLLKEWLILDCMHSYPQETCKTPFNLMLSIYG